MQTIKPDQTIFVQAQKDKGKRRLRIAHRAKDDRPTNKVSKWESDQKEYSTRRPITRDQRRARALAEHGDLAAIGIDVESCFA